MRNDFTLNEYSKEDLLGTKRVMTNKKSYKYTTEVIIPELQRLRKLVVTLNNQNKLLKASRDTKQKLILKQKRDLKIATDIIKNQGVSIKKTFGTDVLNVRTVRHDKGQKKGKRKISPRREQIKKANKLTAVESRELAEAYVKDKVLMARIKSEPMNAMLAFPITELYYEETGVKQKHGRALMIMSCYKWFVPVDAEPWGIPSYTFRRYLFVLIKEGYVTYYEERSRKTYKVTPKGESWTKGLIAFHKKQVQLILDNDPNKDFKNPYYVKNGEKTKIQKELNDGQTES